MIVTWVCGLSTVIHYKELMLMVKLSMIKNLRMILKRPLITKIFTFTMIISSFITSNVDIKNGC